MAAYSDAGLSALQKVSGHRVETLTSLVNCSNFRRTHNFLLHVFQAFYQYFISLYLARATPRQMSLIEDSIVKILAGFAQIKTDTELPDFRIETNDILCKLPCKYQELAGLIEDLSKKQATIRVWYNFITNDCFVYLALFDSIRYRIWHLRVGSLKLMG